MTLRSALCSSAWISLVACGGGGGGGAPDAARVDAAAAVDAAPLPCAPSASCTAGHACLSLADNTGTSDGLRVSELDFAKPDAFHVGLVANVFAGDVTPSLAACNEAGTGTTSLLFRFDTGADTLEIGGARPVADPTQGYSFDDETLDVGGTQFHVQPITTSAMVDGSGAFSGSFASGLLFPIFLDQAGTSLVLLPLQHVAVSGTLSADHDCIGSYNAAGLDPNNSCAPDATHPLFVTGANLTSFIQLEDADTIPVSAIAESLCVLLSGDAATYGDGAQPIQHCKRTGGVIDFQGDWCSTTDSAGGCMDAMAVDADLAASAIQINN